MLKYQPYAAKKYIMHKVQRLRSVANFSHGTLPWPASWLVADPPRISCSSAGLTVVFSSGRLRNQAANNEHQMSPMPPKIQKAVRHENWACSTTTSQIKGVTPPIKRPAIQTAPWA